MGGGMFCDLGAARFQCSECDNFEKRGWTHGTASCCVSPCWHPQPVFALGSFGSLFCDLGAARFQGFEREKLDWTDCLALCCRSWQFGGMSCDLGAARLQGSE